MYEPLWTSADMAAVTGGDATAAFAVSGLSIDTRSLRPGDLFIALQDVRDGHDFTAAGFERGAVAALVSKDVDARGPFLKVPDVLLAVENLAIAARARSSAVRTAVTGSVGKTSVKEMLARIFRAAGSAHWPEKSFNNHWGVPLTLARMPRATDRAVFEIGMSTPGEIAPRSKLVRPHHALITKIAPAHLEGLGSLEGVAREKADIFAGLEAGGTIIVPEDDDFRDLLAEIGREACPSASVESFGTQSGATARLVAADNDGERSDFSFEVAGRQVRVTLGAIGDHWGVNAAAALLMASLTGIAVADAAEALNGFTPPPGRGTSETLTLPGGGSVTLIDDAYNANPESMGAALRSLSQRPSNRRILVLGEMLEIGDGADAAHRDLFDPIFHASPDHVCLGGPGMRVLADVLQGKIATDFEPDSAALLEKLKNLLNPGDLVLIKGSNASGMGLLADALREWSAVESAAQQGPRIEGAGRGKDAL